MTSACPKLALLVVLVAVQGGLSCKFFCRDPVKNVYHCCDKGNPYTTAQPVAESGEGGEGTQTANVAATNVDGVTVVTTTTTNSTLVEYGPEDGAKYSEPSGCRYYCAYANSVYCCDDGSLTSKYKDLITSRPPTQLHVYPTTDKVLQDEILYEKRFKDKKARLPDIKKINAKKEFLLKDGVLSKIDPGRLLSTLEDRGENNVKKHALKRVKRVKRSAEEKSIHKPKTSRGSTSYDKMRKSYLKLNRSNLNNRKIYSPHYPMFIQPFNHFRMVSPSMSPWFMNGRYPLPQLQDLRHFSLTQPKDLSFSSFPHSHDLSQFEHPRMQDVSHSPPLQPQDFSQSQLPQQDLRQPQLPQQKDLSQSQLSQQQGLSHTPPQQSQNLSGSPLAVPKDLIKSQLPEQPDLSHSPPPQPQGLSHSSLLLPQVLSSPEILKTTQLNITRALPSFEILIPGIKQDAPIKNHSITAPRLMDASESKELTHILREIIFFNISDVNASNSRKKRNTSLEFQSSNIIERSAAAPDFLDFSQLPPIPFPMKQRLPDLPSIFSSDTEAEIGDEVTKILVPAGPHLIGPVSNGIVGVPQPSDPAYQNSRMYPAGLGLQYTQGQLASGGIHSMQGQMTFPLLNPNMHYGANIIPYPGNNFAASYVPLRQMYYNGNPFHGTIGHVISPALAGGYLRHPLNNLPRKNLLFFEQIVDPPQVFPHSGLQQGLAFDAQGNPLLQAQIPLAGFTAQLKKHSVIENIEPLVTDNMSEVRALFNVPPPLSPTLEEGFSFIDDSSKSHEISVAHQEIVHVIGEGGSVNTIQNDHRDNTLDLQIDNNPTSTVVVPSLTRADQTYRKVKDDRNHVQEHMTPSSGHGAFNRPDKGLEIIMGTPYIISDAGEVKQITVNFGDPALSTYKRSPISSPILNSKPQSIRQHHTKRDEISRTSGAQLNFPFKDFPQTVYELDDLPFQKLRGHKVVRTELDDQSFQKLRGHKIEITDHGRIAPNSQFTHGKSGHEKRHALSGGHGQRLQTQTQLFSLTNPNDPKYDHSKYIRAGILGDPFTVTEAPKFHDNPEHITVNHRPHRELVKQQNFPQHSTLSSRFNTFNEQRHRSDSLNSSPIQYATEIVDQVSHQKSPEASEFTSSHSPLPESNYVRPPALMTYPENHFHLVEHAKPKSIAEQISVLEKICPCLNLPGPPFFQQRCRCPAVDNIVVAFRKHETDPYSILTYNDFIKKHLNQITPVHIILNNERPFFEDGNNETPERVNLRSDVSKKWLPTLPTKAPGSPVAQNHIEDMFMISIPKDERPTTFKLVQDGKDTSDIIDEKKLKPMKRAVEAFVKDLEQLLF